MYDYNTCQEYYDRAISFWQHCGVYPSYISWNKISIALAKLMNNEKDINLNEIFKWHEGIKDKWADGGASNCIGRILSNYDDQHISEAEKWNLAQDYALYAEFYKRKNDPSKAKENLNKAIEIFKECGADGWVERYEKDLDSLS